MKERELYDVMIIRKEATGLPYDIWVNELCGNGKPKYSSPRLKVVNEDCEVSISISDNPQPLEGQKNVYKMEQLNLVQKFVTDHVFAFLLHWEGEWDSGALGAYCVSVGKRKMSKKDAIQKLIDVGLVDEIPELKV